MKYDFSGFISACGPGGKAISENCYMNGPTYYDTRLLGKTRYDTKRKC